MLELAEDVHDNCILSCSLNRIVVEPLNALPPKVYQESITNQRL